MFFFVKKNFPPRGPQRAPKFQGQKHVSPKVFQMVENNFFLRNFGLDLKKWPQERLGVPPDRHTHFRPKTEDKRKIFYKKRKKKSTKLK